MDEGKSVWRVYALCRCLTDKRQVIWYEAGEAFLFSEQGVHLLAKNQLRPWGPTWTLVDTDFVPSHLIACGANHFVIFCTSPQASHWSRLHKSVYPVLIIMNPWKRKEIIRVCVAFLISYCVCSNGYMIPANQHCHAARLLRKVSWKCLTTLAQPLDYVSITWPVVSYKNTSGMLRKK